MREIGLLCGTFNPVHWGHLLIAECARDQFALDKVLFITSGRPPHRDHDLLDAEDRHAMVEAAVKNNPFFEASRMELDRPGPSYTVDTLRQVKKEEGEHASLNLIVGADNVPYVEQWKEAAEIFKLSRLLVAPRSKSSNAMKNHGQPTEHPVHPANIAAIDLPEIGISSSYIRERLREDATVLYMVPPGAIEILAARGFYTSGAERKR